MPKTQWRRAHTATCRFDGYAGGFQVMHGGPGTCDVPADRELPSMTFWYPPPTLGLSRWDVVRQVRIDIYATSAKEARHMIEDARALFEPSGALVLTVDATPIKLWDDDD
jgi:hypothetical protein